MRQAGIGGLPSGGPCTLAHNMVLSARPAVTAAHSCAVVVCVCLCRIDNLFPGRWVDQHNQWLQGNFTAAKEALAQEVYTNMTNTLKDVKGIVDRLNQLATIGMPQGSLNAFLKSYPLQQCDAIAPSTTAAAGRGLSKLLAGDGAVPLPDGAVLKPAAAPAAPVVAPSPPMPATSVQGGMPPAPAAPGSDVMPPAPATPVEAPMPPMPASPVAAPMPPMASPSVAGGMSPPPASQAVGTTPPAPASAMAAPMPPMPATSVEAPKAASGNRKMLL